MYSYFDIYMYSYFDNYMYSYLVEEIIGLSKYDYRYIYI